MSDPSPFVRRLPDGRWENADLDPVVIEDYDPSWPVRFAAEAAALRRVLPADLAPVLEHVGSTAVPGLPAKPIIDIDLRGPSTADWPRLTAPLAALGYVPWEEPGHLLFVKGMPPYGDRRTHHLHLFAHPEPYAERILFRDHLCAHSAEAERYAALKRELASRYATDREAYTEGKRTFITAALLRARGECP
jgi:GrpB-like predicted nucleotidyltransferase (UPF0157 family)